MGRLPNAGGAVARSLASEPSLCGESVTSLQTRRVRERARLEMVEMSARAKFGQQSFDVQKQFMDILGVRDTGGEFFRCSVQYFDMIMEMHRDNMQLNHIRRFLRKKFDHRNEIGDLSGIWFV